MFTALANYQRCFFMETLFDLTPYPLIEKPKSRGSVAQFYDLCQENEGLLSLTMAGILVDRPKQQICQLTQSGKVKWVEVEGRKYVSVKSLMEWKNALQERKVNATSSVSKH